MQEKNGDLLLEIHDEIGIITINRPVTTNPMDKSTNDLIIRQLSAFDQDPAIKGVVLTGGIGRSFCAGGDFNEVQELSDSESVVGWIDRTIGLYLAPITFSKPAIAAVDQYAIGIGFQLALSCDWRLGADSCSFIMPEIKHGISCIIGSYMLEKFLSRAAMQRIIFGCEPIAAPEALEIGLINAITPAADLINEAVRQAKVLANYPVIPFRNTKRALNASFVDGLKHIASVSKAAHAESFAAKTAQAHFRKILKSKQ